MGKVEAGLNQLEIRERRREAVELLYQKLTEDGYVTVNGLGHSFYRAIKRMAKRHGEEVRSIGLGDNVYLLAIAGRLPKTLPAILVENPDNSVAVTWETRELEPKERGQAISIADIPDSPRAKAIKLALARGPVQTEEPHHEDGDNKTEKEDFHD